MNKVLVNKAIFFLNLLVFILLFIYTLINFFKIDNETSLVETINTDIKKKNKPISFNTFI